MSATFTVEVLKDGLLPLAGLFDDVMLAEENPEIFIDVALTAVTFPVANPAFADPEKRRADPPGTFPPPGGPPEPVRKDPPAGGPPDPPGNPPPLAGPPDPLPVDLPNPPVHFPDVGWLTVTVLAVTSFDFFEVDPETVTQSPTATEEAGTVAIWVKVVDVVQLTVTWPLKLFCTSIDDPVMAATLPKAPGKERPDEGADVEDAAPASVATPRTSRDRRAATVVTESS